MTRFRQIDMQNIAILLYVSNVRFEGRFPERVENRLQEVAGAVDRCANGVVADLSMCYTILVSTSRVTIVC